MHYEHLDPHYTSLPRLIVQNNVTGCTILMNRHLREKIRIPQPMFMYDWWIALTASAFGEISYLNDATVMYRQHQQNAVGAANVRSASYAVRRLKDPGSMQRSLEGTYALAQAFCECYSGELKPEQIRFLKAYDASRNAGVFRRFYVLSKYRAYKKGLMRRLAQIFVR